MATIYISSDPKEFGTYREAVRERLRDHGHKARTRDELETGSKATLLQQVDDAILKSDAVLCLMGERYGTEPPEKEREARGGERRSYTQWEYLLAKRYDKPVHVFYADDEAPLDVPNDEGKDFTKLQETFLAEEIVSKGIACKAFRDQADLVKQVLQLQTAWPQAREVTLQNPYVGLRRFEEKDRDRFFGRDHLVQELLTQIESHRFTAVVGQSGAGKSSLVRAGVIPAWRKDHPDGKVIVFQPDRDPFGSLSGALALGGFDPGRVKLASDPSECVFRDLRRGSSRASDPLGMRSKPASEPWLIFIDQFEEICTRPGHSLDEQECIRRFVASLEDAVRLDDPAVTILVALRDDFFGCLRSHPGLYPLLDSRLVRVAIPDGRALRTIIEAPARTHGARFEDGLVSTLLADMEESGGGLPFLEDTLAQLWEAETGRGLESGVLKAETCQNLGGVRSSLARRMDRYLQAKTPEEQRSVQNLLLALVGIQSFAGTIHTFSRPLPRSELLEKGGRGSQELLRELIADLKILVAAEEANPFDPMVELAHESLIRGWDRLERWVAGTREALELRQQLTYSAQIWQRLRADPKPKSRQIKALLWQGGRLARALECDRVEPLSKQSEFERIGGLGLMERDFLKASEQRMTRAHKLVHRLTVAACTALLAASGAWIFFARKELAAREQMRNTDLESKLAEARKEASMGWLARARAEGATTEAAFYAARAIGFQGAGIEAGAAPDGRFPRWLPADEAGQAKATEALRLVSLSPLPFVWSSPAPVPPAPAAPDQQSAGAAVAWSPDGKWFASGGPGAAVALWDARQGEPARKLEGHQGPVTCLAFSPDGTLLASGGTDKSVRLWKVPSGEPAAACQGHSGWIGAVAFRPDGLQLASGGYDETVRIWDVATGKETAVRSGDLGFVYSVAFHPDGSLLAAGGEHEAVQIWTADSGTLRNSLKGHSRSVNCLSFSPDGQHLATGSSDQLVKVWDLESGQARETLSGHAGGVTSLAWSASGDRLASASADHKIRVWNLKTGAQEAVFAGHDAEVSSLAWDPASTLLLSAGRLAGDLKLWVVPPAGATPAEIAGKGPPPRNLARFVEGGWAQFDAATGDLVWKLQPQGLAYQEDLLHPDSWIGILRQAPDDAARTRALFRAALSARDWAAAILLARDVPPEQRQTADELTGLAARSLVEAATQAVSPGMARLRIEQGRALVAWHDTWKEFDPDPSVAVDSLVAKVKPPPPEPKKPEETLASATPVPGGEGAPANGAMTGPNGEASPADGSAPEGAAALRATVIGQAPASQPTVHVVQAGDNPFTIAKKYGISMEEIMKFNQIKDPRRLQIGTELKIPAGAAVQPVVEAPEPPPEPEDPNFRYHSVRSGENPSIIARKYRVTERDLMKINDIDDPSKLQIGQRLKIPNPAKPTR